METKYPIYDNYETDPVEKLELKYKSEQELLNTILAGAEWSPDDHERILAAYELASYLHREDTYKATTYIYHLLRVAARLVTYMEINDADVIVAALLHDSVEDHPEELIPGDLQLSFDKSRADLQSAALSTITEIFGDRASTIVRAVTNPPSDDKVRSYEQKLQDYAHKVEDATSEYESWLVKFADWCDNGLGLIHSELDTDSKQFKHLRRKYGGDVLRAFTIKFREYRHNLSPKAANYVAMQLTLGYQRLELELR